VNETEVAVASPPLGGDRGARMAMTDYAQTTGLARDLADTRFKLVALVPTISGAAVALLSRHPSAAQLIAVGALGLTATVGVVVYELRNTQVYEYALRRAAALERALEIPSPFEPSRPGGLFAERPARELRVFGLAVAHERGLALVYAAAIGGWTYLLAWGGLHLLGVQESQRAGGLLGTLVAAVVLTEFLRLGGRVTDAKAAS
jgi:hypothetical protein